MKLGKYDIGVDDIVDVLLRENIKKMLNYFNEDPFLKSGSRFFTYKALAAGSFTVPHNLGYTPLDVMVTSISQPDTGTVSFKYDKFNDKTITFVTSGPLTFRAYLGRYKD